MNELALAFGHDWLGASIWWLDIGLGALFLRMTSDLTGGAWAAFAGSELRRAITLIMPLAILFMPLLAYTPVLSALAADGPPPGIYPEPGFIAARTVAVFAVWVVLAVVLGGRRGVRRRRRTSVVGLLLFVPAVTLFTTDWIVLPEAPWYSSAAGIVTLAGQAVAALAFVILALCLRHRRTGDPEVTARLQDLANLLLAAILFWIYVLFMEYLVIWSADLPHETVWYRNRRAGIWPVFGVALILLKFVLPFIALVSRRVKRDPTLLGLVAGCVLAGHWFDAWWRTQPAAPAGAAWLDAVAVVALSAAMLVFLRLSAGSEER